MTTYGERIAQIQDDLGMTNDQLAAEIGIPPRTLQDIVAGKVSRPQRKTRDRIDAYLGLRREGEAAEEWTPEVKAFVDMLGAYLAALPEHERTAFIADTIRHMARRD